MLVSDILRELRTLANGASSLEVERILNKAFKDIDLLSWHERIEQMPEPISEQLYIWRNGNTITAIKFYRRMFPDHSLMLIKRKFESL